ncbi:hypothetical protein N825_33845 [Skermanella stibiiresistens SB22]|uniref:Lipoprotein n=1 Tax=Skermanella stibiiresistens SB22 TaxID=1385369 RepID=W9H8A3_9PROT|nr:hypothetical protein [Skermanella stibiiresistens]EWY40917.1 hypothetical protein N825_33845 [Skermanella stibiiresistens SB22]
MNAISRSGVAALLLLGGCSLPDLGPQTGGMDISLRHLAPRTSYVMDVAEDGDRLIVSMRPAVVAPGFQSGEEGAAIDAAPADTSAPDEDRVLAPCRKGAGDWYRHTPLGYVCVGEPASNLSAALP